MGSMARDHPTRLQAKRDGRRQEQTLVRKLIVVFAVLASAFGVVCSTGAAPASAATCSAATGGITYNGYWAWPASLYSCSGVNAVEFGSPANNGAWLVDVTRGGAVHFTLTGGGVINGVNTNYFTTYQNIIWGNGCGWPAFQVYKAYKWRIRNSTGSTWGAWHVFQGGDQLLC